MDRSAVYPAFTLFPHAESGGSYEGCRVPQDVPARGAVPMEQVLLLIFPAAMLLAAFFDIGTLKIPNWLTGTLALAFFPVALLLGLPLADMGAHVAAGLAVLLLGMAAFARNYMGGGDAKLMAAAALWIDWQHLLAFALIAALAGGALAIAISLFRRLPLPGVLVRQAWLMRLHDRDEGIPYAVALAAAALAVFPQTYWVAMVG